MALCSRLDKWGQQPWVTYSLRDTGGDAAIETGGHGAEGPGESR